jgi:hypothetical protein
VLRLRFLLPLLGQHRFPLAIRLAFDRDDLGVMGEPVDERDGARRIREDGRSD